MVVVYNTNHQHTMGRDFICRLAVYWMFLGVFHRAASLDIVQASDEMVPPVPRHSDMLFDFSKLTSVSNWTEMSDTVRTVGMSKAILTLQKTQMFQRAIFFSLLNPQVNGAGFAGVRTKTDLDLSSCRSLMLRARVQGDNVHYKMVLRHRGEDQEPFPTYENFFTAPQGEFADIELPLANFVPYYRGRPQNDSEPLDLTRISSLGLQVYGGVYSPTKQAGPGSLEIDWIKGVPK